jgi:hypothetical protein
MHAGCLWTPTVCHLSDTVAPAILNVDLASVLAGWDCVEDRAAKLRPHTIKTLMDKANTCITTVTPAFKTAWRCRSIQLVTGSVVIPQGKAHGQARSCALRLALACWQPVSAVLQ